MEIDLDKIKNIYFIGIGGIGISAIAQMMNLAGKNVSGSDISQSPITEKISQMGIKVHIGQTAKNISHNIDLVVRTIAVPEDNSEILEAQKKGLRIVTYPEMLSVISKNMYTIAVSGTHGKTTTTAMISKIMIEASLDPTVIVGSLMNDSGSNLVVGKSNYFLVEACEYKRSFLNLYPKILVITNIDEDHLDYYKDIKDIQSAFRELAERIPKDGVIICDSSDPRLKPVIENLKTKIIDYTSVKTDLDLKIPGKHNIQNAYASISVADFLGIDKSKAISSLQNFTGTWRRFDLKGKTKNGSIVYDDYAHHPREIIATLLGAREKFPDKKITVFFQPHLFSRTKILLEDFSKSFTEADKVYILPIYPARETFDPTINSEMLTEKINSNGKPAKFIKNFEEAERIISSFDSNNVILTMGAGSVYKICQNIINNKIFKE